MTVRLAVAALVNSVFVNVKAIKAANMARRIYIGYFLPIANYTQFILNQYREVGQKRSHTATQKKLWGMGIQPFQKHNTTHPCLT